MCIRDSLITGDNANTAEAIGRQAGIEDLRSNVRPEEKAGIISQLQSEGKLVGMAGDGINDAVALAQADVEMCIRDRSKG